MILGAQSQHIISTLKHYTAYNQDWGRIGFDAIGAPAVNVAVSERGLQEIYETPFRIAVQQGGVDSVMCSYNQINGVPSCENPTTLGDLKQGDGLNGFVVPDFGFAVRNPVAAENAGGGPRGARRSAERPDRRGLHLGSDLGLAPRRRGPPDPVRDVRLGRV
ncbi:MAG: glycoside hydrolase family 3 N-terminal domain-containing protein [Solirubrobacteraceae bacterium]